MLNLWKPWYVRQPNQLAKRIFRAVRGTPYGSVTLTTPWGVELTVDPRETIGHALWTTGIYDLAATESLFRLARPGHLHLDIGANLGYMTGLLAFRAGSIGRVLAFEPHPVVGVRLQENIARIARCTAAAPVEFFQVALSDSTGEAKLIDPDGFSGNTGMAHLATTTVAGGTVVTTRRLDDVLGDRIAEVVKIDVEGHEAAVLRGAERALAEKRIRHILFEEHGGPLAESVRMLHDAGYVVFQLGWQMSGPLLAELSAPTICKPYEAPNYLATTSPDSVLGSCSTSGWFALAGSMPEPASRTLAH